MYAMFTAEAEVSAADLCLRNGWVLSPQAIL